MKDRIPTATNGIIALFAVALRKTILHDRCCPDVGMGPSPEMLLDEIEAETGVTLNTRDRGHVLRMVRAALGENR